MSSSHLIIIEISTVLATFLSTFPNTLLSLEVTVILPYNVVLTKQMQKSMHTAAVVVAC